MTTAVRVPLDRACSERLRGYCGPMLSGESASTAWEEARAAATRADVVFEPCLDADSAGALIEAFNLTWDADPREPVIDLSTAVALAASGNYVVAALQDERVIGGGLAFFGPPAAESMHSHIVGIVPGLTARGLGLAVKLHQRAWCLDRGVTTMTWTFDPLIARNAYFNLAKLGARAVAYHPDHYGVLTDGLNAGQATDRIVIAWDLTAPLPGPHEPDAVDSAAGLGRAGDAPGEWVAPRPSDRVASVALPDDVEGLRRTDPDLARRWRTATRAAFDDLAADGWRVNGFDSGHYRFAREDDR
ncbi:hypothetical protein [Nocardioides sp. GXZ039]|uniref:hypothetical protein n=1 Tax=Nocardioides sp. GXZ039 TaxID=3136018 RepID=UPI0030F400B1